LALIKSLLLTEKQKVANSKWFPLCS